MRVTVRRHRAWAGPVRLGVGLALSLMAPVWVSGGEGHPPELRRVHALLVIDTQSGLSESVAIDGARVERLLRSSIPPHRAEIRILTGKDVRAEEILAYYRNLNVTADDALFFYYAGHGATDPARGQFLALQELHTKPLIRSELRNAMQQHHPGLCVIVTDCCSDRFKLPGKTRGIQVEEGAAKQLQPVVRCLLFEARGVVDVMAASGNEAYGDDHDGGIFTRTFDRLVHMGISPLDGDGDGFVSWREFFRHWQAETEGTFRTWAAKQRKLGEDVSQRSQKPFAFALGSDAAAHTVRLNNQTEQVLAYEFRWTGQDDWSTVRLPPHGAGEHVPPSVGNAQGQVSLEVRFEGGKHAVLTPGKTYRFHDDRATHSQPGSHAGKP